MTNLNEAEVARLVDRAAIQDALLKWARAIDRLEWGLLSEVFHDDAHDNHSLYRGHTKGLVEWLSERHETIPRSSHLISNMLIEFADNDVALVETYVVTLQRYSAGRSKTREVITGGANTSDAPFDMISNGRYIDRFERRNGLWKIAYRTVVFDVAMTMAVPDDDPKFDPDWTLGTRDSSDPIWKLRAEVGL
jgi:hypothetical protein